MVELRDEGKTRFIALLGFDAALASDISALDAVLGRHNYYMRGEEAKLERIRQTHPHIGIISLEPIGRGRFATDYAPPGVSMAAACLRYAL